MLAFRHWFYIAWMSCSDQSSPVQGSFLKEVLFPTCLQAVLRLQFLSKNLVPRQCEQCIRQKRQRNALLQSVNDGEWRSQHLTQDPEHELNIVIDSVE